MRILITGPVFKKSMALAHALRELPGARNITVVEYGNEPKAEEGDRWVFIDPPPAGSEAERYPASHWNGRIVSTEDVFIDNSWLGLLMYLNLTGAACQIARGLDRLKEELAE